MVRSSLASLNFPGDGVDKPRDIVPCWTPSIPMSWMSVCEWMRTAIETYPTTLGMGYSGPTCATDFQSLALFLICSQILSAMTELIAGWAVGQDRHPYIPGTHPHDSRENAQPSPAWRTRTLRMTHT